MNAITPLDERLGLKQMLTVAEVCEILGVSRNTIATLTREDGFPGPVKIGRRANRWRVAEVAAWIDTRPAA